MTASSAALISLLCVFSALIVGQFALALAFGVAVLIAMCWRSEETLREIDRERHRAELKTLQLQAEILESLERERRIR